MSHPPTGRGQLLTLTTEIVRSHVANNTVAVSDLSGVIRQVYTALSRLGAAPATPPTKQAPAVPIRASVRSDHIVCLEDGQKLKMLKRYLASRYDMTPAQYRAKWGLPSTYPMVAPAYAALRQALAVKMWQARRPSALHEASPGAPLLLDPREATPTALGSSHASRAGTAAAKARGKTAAAPPGAASAAPSSASRRTPRVEGGDPEDQRLPGPRPRRKLTIAVPG